MSTRSAICHKPAGTRRAMLPGRKFEAGPSAFTASATRQNPKRLPKDAFVQMSPRRFRSVRKGSTEPTMPRVPMNRRVDITDLWARRNLLRSCPQINPISMSAKPPNGRSLCGAAAVTNALVLSVKDGESSPTRSGEALDKLCKATPGFKFKPGEEAAVQALRDGKLSPRDVMHLQQVVHRLAKAAVAPGRDGPTTSFDTRDMAAVLSMLRARGAFKGSHVTLSCNQQPGLLPHWTCTVDTTHADSDATGARSKVQWGTPKQLGLQGKSLRQEMVINGHEEPGVVHVRHRGENLDGTAAARFRTADVKVDEWGDPDHIRKQSNGNFSTLIWTGKTLY